MQFQTDPGFEILFFLTKRYLDIEGIDNNNRNCFCLYIDGFNYLLFYFETPCNFICAWGSYDATQNRFGPRVLTITVIT